jgi:hypothetical protein
MPHHYSQDEIQAVMDNLAIKKVLEHYFYGEGCLDPDIMIDCFTDDARFGPAEGRDAIYKLFQQIKYFQHVLACPATQHIVIDGDEARVDMQAIGFMFRGDGGSAGPRGRIMVQGVRYNDVLVRTEQGWKIKHRIGRHTPQSGHDTEWQFDAASVPPHLD